MIVSTDLDGTLLDHFSYSWQAARPAMEKLASLGIPVILNSSKTYAEIRALQEQLGLSGPFIVENGSALFLPVDDFAWLLTTQPADQAVIQVDGYLQIVFGAQRATIIDYIGELRRQHGWDFEGFNDWTVAQIMTYTGLDEESASQAADKMFSEPIQWNDSEPNLSSFTKQLKTSKLSLLKGGRFYHVQGQTDKGRPLLWLQALYTSKTDATPPLVCLGDSENDIQMLNVADHPVCIRSPVSDFPVLQSDKPVIKTTAYGPAGWNEAINAILSTELQ
jgi:mannosyl-3-phosphoglycerate phosphatase